MAGVWDLSMQMTAVLERMLLYSCDPGCQSASVGLWGDAVQMSQLQASIWFKLLAAEIKKRSLVDLKHNLRGRVMNGVWGQEPPHGCFPRR